MSGPFAPPAPPTPPPGNGTGRDPRRLVGLLLLVAGLVGAGTALLVPAADQVRLTAAADPGTDPFVAGGTVVEAPAPAPNLPTPPASTRVDTAPNSLATYPGTTPGLYGGTKGVSTCNTEEIVGYLESNPGPAAAWAKVPRIPPSTIRAFVTGLAPVILRTDTRVISYGLRDDRAVPTQAVLQSGTSVLVDPAGVPRVRCGSGNPLDGPRSRPGTPTFLGTPWPRFSPSTVIVIAPTRPIGSIIIVDLGDGAVIIRVPGDLGRDAVIAVLPALLRPGDPVVVTGRGFPPGVPVTIRYDLPATVLGTATADGGGTINVTVAIPEGTGPGLRQVVAEGGGAVNVLPVYILAPGT